MKIWVDAHISPGIAAWINENFEHEAKSLSGLGLRHADDLEIFDRAKTEDAVLITKDSDFIDILELKGSPPKVLLLRCGNTSNQKLREVFGAHLIEAIQRFEEGESLVEIQ